MNPTEVLNFSYYILEIYEEDDICHVISHPNNYKNYTIKLNQIFLYSKYIDELYTSLYDIYDGDNDTLAMKYSDFKKEIKKLYNRDRIHEVKEKNNCECCNKSFYNIEKHNTTKMHLTNKQRFDKRNLKNKNVIDQINQELE